MLNEDGHTIKQARFIVEYCKDFNGTQAAIRAGYSEHSAQEIASENLSKPIIRIAIDKKLTINQADVGARRADIITSIGGEAELPKALVGASLAASNFDAYLRILIISERLNSDLTAAGMPQEQATEEVTKLVTLAATKLGVKVNAKYGKWNPATASIEVGDATGGAVTPLP
jgi:phage terminase small subunit